MAPVEAEIFHNIYDPRETLEIQAGSFKNIDLPPFKLSVFCDQGNTQGTATIDGPRDEMVDVFLHESSNDEPTVLDRNEPIKFSGSQKVEIQMWKPFSTIYLQLVEGSKELTTIDDRDLVPV